MRFGLAAAGRQSLVAPGAHGSGVVPEPALVLSGGTYGLSNPRQDPHTLAADARPRVELLTAGSRRNLVRWARLIQSPRAGERVVVCCGSGHLFPLHPCIAETRASRPPMRATTCPRKRTALVP